MKLIRSFVFAFNGFRACFVAEVNFRIHLLFTIITVAMGIAFKISATEWLAIIFCIGFVIALEMVNTAIEKLCDMVHKDIHPVIKMIKDTASGAVLLAAICSVVIGGIIFLPKIMLLFKV